MKFLFTADWHLSKYSTDKIDQESGLPEKLVGIKNSIYQMGNYCRENDIKNIVIAGDIFHGKSIIYAVALSILIDYFRDFSDLHFYIFSGNHDLSGKSHDVISALKSINEPNVTKFEVPTQIENVLFVPYDAEKMISYILTHKCEYLISHFGLSEGTLSSGISIISDISLRGLSNKYKTVLLGHYHVPQQILSEKINMYYAGSPTQLDFGERDQEKRFLIVDSKTHSIQSILTEGYKKFYRFKITNENKDEVIKEALRLKEEGHYVDLEKNDIVNDLDEISSSFRIIDKFEKDPTNRGISSSMTQIERIRKYLEIKNINPDNFEEYEKVALQIINTCSEEM